MDEKDDLPKCSVPVEDKNSTAFCIDFPGKNFISFQRGRIHYVVNIYGNIAKIYHYGSKKDPLTSSIEIKRVIISRDPREKDQEDRKGPVSILLEVDDYKYVVVGYFIDVIETKEKVTDFYTIETAPYETEQYLITQTYIYVVSEEVQVTREIIPEVLLYDKEFLWCWAVRGNCENSTLSPEATKKLENQILKHIQKLDDPPESLYRLKFNFD